LKKKVPFLILYEITAGEKSKAAVLLNKSKKRVPKSVKSSAKAAWGQLLSQCSQVSRWCA